VFITCVFVCVPFIINSRGVCVYRILGD
jgi:uncharacterized membrane protein YccC